MKLFDVLLKYMVWILFLCIGGAILFALRRTASPGGVGIWGILGLVTVCLGVCLFGATKVSKTLAKMDLDRADKRGNDV